MEGLKTKLVEKDVDILHLREDYKKKEDALIKFNMEERESM